MLESREYIELNSASIERGYKSCKGAVKKFFKPQLWALSNLPGEQRRSMDAVLFNLMRSIDLLDLDSIDGLSLDIWHEMRDDLSDALQDKCTTVELAALADTARKYNIPQQYLFDPLRGADQWIRTREFKTFDQLETFCSQVGGASMAAAIPVLGPIEEGWELDAVGCGKAVMLTQLLGSFINDLKQNKVFLAKDDLEDCEVDLPRLKMRRESKELRYLVRLYTSRIEKMFLEASGLASYLDFDGNRSMKSFLSMNWKMLQKMKVEPECILAEEGVLSGRDQLSLKSRHLLGMDKVLPCVKEVEHAHH